MTNADYRAKWTALTAANGGIAPIEKHNVSTYNNWGCRCNTCYKAKQRYNKECKLVRFAKTAANKGIAPTKNHNFSTYLSWNCRCKPCRLSYKEYVKERKNRRRTSNDVV